jgi:transposase
MTQLPLPRSGSENIIIGIDWADKVHAICLIDPQRPQPVSEQLEQHPDTISQWAARLRQKYPDRQLCVVLEQSRGPLVESLLATGQFVLVPINPKQLARFREALYPSGGKNDPTDAELLARFFLQHGQQLRPLRPDDEQTRQLAYLTELRRKLVEERKRLNLQLASVLKLYFPWLQEVFGDRLDEPLVTKLLQRWPTLKHLQREKPSIFERFLREHGVRASQKRQQLVAAVRTVSPLTTDPAILEPNSLYAQALAQQLEHIVQSIARFDEQIEQLVEQHPDTPLFRPLPGAGAALLPRLIVAFGSDRERYDTAVEVQNYSGIAPITRQSGKTRTVERRWVCPKFLHQTFHEFADHSRRWSVWAKLWYNHKKASGMKHQAIVRALAFKWIRVLFRVWKERRPYSEQHYIQALIKSNSPIAALLKNQTI